MIAEDQDFLAIAAGAKFSGVLPYIEAELQKSIDACIVRMDQLLSVGKLTPDLAQMAWLELLSYRRLMRRFQQKVRIGLAAGDRQNAIAELAAIDPPLPYY